MDVLGHPVGFCRVVKRLFDIGPSQADIQIDGQGGLVEPVEVLAEKGKSAIVKPEALPDPVAQHETGVIDRDLGLVAMQDLAVHVDLEIVVSRVRIGIVGAIGGCCIFHGLSFAALRLAFGVYCRSDITLRRALSACRR